ncbi:DUF6415 family natural product biosynthesis protein [Streptomyces sp. 5.8]|uniref:DUF6415 family natural product biosynthesis protein n=1 Tax=Streptomyces sp. 5.8 TaxID=3406571 RepID=UPI003BB62817
MADRDIVASAAETVALVLGEDSPLPETDQDVADLVWRLRGHIMRLGTVTAPGGALDIARRLSGAELPAGYVPSRVYLRQLALAARDLITAPRAETHSVVGREAGAGRWECWRPTKNTVRVLVFIVAVAVLALASSVPRQ